MKDRLFTLLFALLAFVLSIYLIMPPPTQTRPISLPTTVDHGSAGLQGLFRWLQSNNITVLSFRKRFDDLIDNKNLSSTGNLLILSLPQRQIALEAEWLALQRWVSRGNSILMLGAGYSSPQWASDLDCFCDFNEMLNGLDWELYSEPSNDNNDQPEKEDEDLSFKQEIENIQASLKTLKPKQVDLLTSFNHAALQSISFIHTKIKPSLLEDNWQIEAEKNSLALQLLKLPEANGLTFLWQIEAGEGQIFLSLVDDFFSNEMLNKADNAQLFSNLLALSLTKKGQVIFDDYHFGLSDLYDPEQLFADPRLHKTLAFIALLWLFYALGYSNRLAPVRDRSEKPSNLDFVKATAGFFSHRLDNKTLAQAQIRRLIQDVRQNRHMHDDQAAWQWLLQHPGLQSINLQLLQKAEQKQNLSLHLLTHTISTIREKLLL